VTERRDSTPDPLTPADPALAVPLTTDEPVVEHPAPNGAAPDPGRGSRGSRRAAARDRRRAIREWVILIAVALLVAFVVRQFVFQLFYIPSGSMVPRLEVGDQVFVNKLAYDFGDPARGDLVVFTRPANWSDVPVDDLVKRVVGLPGETIEGREGHVYIDGRRLPERYLPTGTSTSSFGPLTVPPHEYFMMGDNRSGSNDSRMHSPVDRDEFVGKVFMTVWPLDRVSVPAWLVVVVVGGAGILIGIWVFAGRRHDLRGDPADTDAPGGS
jgi:signal peptidase I